MMMSSDSPAYGDVITDQCTQFVMMSSEYPACDNVICVYAQVMMTLLAYEYYGIQPN